MRTVYTGIDIGTYHIKVVVAAPSESGDVPIKIVSTGSAPAKGMRQGYIVDAKEAAKSIREAVSRAAQAGGVPIKRARLALGGVGLEEVKSSGEVTLTASGGIVGDRDMERALKESEKRAGNKLTNRTILHTIPLEYRLDGTKIEGRPQGLQGTKLAVDTLLVTVLTQHYEDAIEAVESAGIEVESMPMASPLAASLVTLTRAQQMAGVILANMGAETTSLVVYDRGVPLSIKVLPLGSADITNAIALSFQIPLHEAEQMKRGAVTGSDIAPRRVQAVVSARLKTLFTLINTHLKTVGRQRLLPAGIVLTGGGSGMNDIVNIARIALKLPAQIGLPTNMPRLASLDASWAVAYGLCRASFLDDATSHHSFGDVSRRFGEAFRSVFRSLLP